MFSSRSCCCFLKRCQSIAKKMCPLPSLVHVIFVLLHPGVRSGGQCAALNLKKPAKLQPKTSTSHHFEFKRVAKLCTFLQKEHKKPKRNAHEFVLSMAPENLKRLAECQTTLLFIRNPSLSNHANSWTELNTFMMPGKAMKQ